MGSIGLPELLVIFAIIVVIFGATRLPEIGRGIGKVADHLCRHIGELAVARPSMSLGLLQLDPPGDHHAAEADGADHGDVPVDETLLLVVPDLADAIHFPAAFGDAVVIEDEVKHFAGLRLHAVQQIQSEYPPLCRKGKGFPDGFFGRQPMCPTAHTLKPPQHHHCQRPGKGYRK